MNIPGVEYGDYYKFVMSIGMLLISLPFVALVYFAPMLDDLLKNASFIVILFIMAFSVAFGTGSCIWASCKWSDNQKILDKELRARTDKAELEVKRLKEGEKKKKALKEIADVRSAERQQTYSRPSERPTTDKREEDIKLFATLDESSGMIDQYMSIEQATLNHLKRTFYPNLQIGASVVTRDETNWVVDALLREGNSMLVIDVMILPMKLSGKYLDGRLKLLKSQIDEFSESHPHMSLRGLLVVVSDFSDGAYKNSWLESIRNCGGSPLGDVSAVLMDLREIQWNPP